MTGYIKMLGVDIEITTRDLDAAGKAAADPSNDHLTEGEAFMLELEALAWDRYQQMTAGDTF